jgi:hypothetical protein
MSTNLPTAVPEVDRPTDSCGCGHEIVWVGGHWEHNVAPYIWGDDHDIDTPAPEGEARKEWDHYDLGLPLKGLTVPPFEMDVAGEYQGNAYPEQREYRIHMIESAYGISMGVEDSSGHEVGTQDFSVMQAEGIIQMAHTDHSIDAYGDVNVPSGFGREIAWVLDTADADVYIRLSEDQISEIADWLEYATGEAEWTGGDSWEER